MRHADETKEAHDWISELQAGQKQHSSGTQFEPSAIHGVLIAISWLKHFSASVLTLSLQPKYFYSPMKQVGENSDHACNGHHLTVEPQFLFPPHCCLREILSKQLANLTRQLNDVS